MVSTSSLSETRIAVRHLIEVELETPAHLARALRCDAPPWELEIDGCVIDAEIGEPVCVSLTVRGHGPHSLRGVVLWRRVSHNARFPSATGIRIDPSEGHAVARLRAIALGRLDDDVNDVLRWRSGAARRTV